MRLTVSRSEQQGITLIELLAVILLLAAGTALLLPTVARRQRETSIMQCMSNLRQLAFASHLYSEDNNDLWPANGRSDASLNLSQIPASYVPRVWAETWETSNMTSPEDAAGMISERVSLLAKYVTDKKAFRCPKDDIPIVVANRAFLRPRTYGMNQFIGWTADPATGATWHGEPNAGSQTFKKIGTTATPEVLFLFGEIHRFSVCHPVFGTHPRWGSEGNATGENRILHLPANNHGRFTTFSMADGHAEIRRWRSARFNDPHYANGQRVSEADPFWHNHDLPLPGVTSSQVAPDLKWLTTHTTVRR